MDDCEEIEHSDSSKKELKFRFLNGTNEDGQSFRAIILFVVLSIGSIDLFVVVLISIGFILELIIVIGNVRPVLKEFVVVAGSLYL